MVPGLLSKRFTVDESFAEIRWEAGDWRAGAVFEGDYLNVWGPSHDVFPDGRILLLKGEEWVPPTEIDVIINALDLAP